MSEQPIKKIEMGLCEGCREVEKWKALCRKLAEASDHLSGIAENISISDSQNMRDKLAEAIAKVDAVLSDARKAGIIT